MRRPPVGTIQSELSRTADGADQPLFLKLRDDRNEGVFFLSDWHLLTASPESEEMKVFHTYFKGRVDWYLNQSVSWLGNLRLPDGKTALPVAFHRNTSDVPMHLQTLDDAVPRSLFGGDRVH